MKTLLILITSLCFLSFCPFTKDPVVENSSNGYFISVKDNTDRTYHEYIVESKDSVDIIFRKYFQSELALAEVDYPISIFNTKLDFYLARVNIYTKSNGKMSFKHLKYVDVYDKKFKKSKRAIMQPALF